MRYILLLVIAAHLAACSIKLVPLTPALVHYQDTTAKSSNACCKDWASYTPDTAHLQYTPIKEVKINFHLIRRADGVGALADNEFREYVRGWIDVSATKLANNQPMRLPLGNQTPVLPPQFRLRLTPSPEYPTQEGMYIHTNDTLCNYVKKGKHNNTYDKRPFQRYAIGKDTIMNVLIFQHHPDSVKSKTYGNTITGIAHGNHIKITGMYEYAHTPVGPEGSQYTRGAWFTIGLLLHELGHNLGLPHTWSNDNCPDTPNHTNCYGQGDKPPCDTEFSNNVMDYNQEQNAFTPCQIGLIQRNMADTSASIRKFLVKNWCTLQPEKTIYITDSVEWKGAKDLEGNLVIKKGGVLTIHCRVSLPPDAQITVERGATLILNAAYLHNDCGKTWKGIQIQKGKKNKENGQVIFRKKNYIRNTTTAFQ
jgi:hypothetical protein